MSELGWEELKDRRFRPAEAAVITGVSTDLQRKWSERYFGDSVDAEHLYHWRLSREGGHNRYSWGGIQALALFASVLSDVGLDVAKVALDRTARGTIVHDFEIDLRNVGGSDLILFHVFGDPRSTFSAMSLEALVGRLASQMPCNRFYVLNFSGMQRRLVANASALLLALR